jgi:hypothetical protein
MTVELSEKDTMAAEEADRSAPTISKSSSIHDVNDSNAGDSNDAGLEKSDESEQYPHGLELVFSAGASIISVFLIALDQVSDRLAHDGNVKKHSDTEDI